MEDVALDEGPAPDVECVDAPTILRQWTTIDLTRPGFARVHGPAGEVMDASYGPTLQSPSPAQR